MTASSRPRDCIPDHFHHPGGDPWSFPPFLKSKRWEFGTPMWRGSSWVWDFFGRNACAYAAPVLDTPHSRNNTLQDVHRRIGWTFESFFPPISSNGHVLIVNWNRTNHITCWSTESKRARERTWPLVTHLASLPCLAEQRVWTEKAATAQQTEPSWPTRSAPCPANQPLAAAIDTTATESRHGSFRPHLLSDSATPRALRLLPGPFFRASSWQTTNLAGQCKKKEKSKLILWDANAGCTGSGFSDGITSGNEETSHTIFLYSLATKLKIGS